MTPASNLLRAIETAPSSSSTQKKQNTQKILSEFKGHLDWLISRHVKKNYQKKYLIDWCFNKNKNFNNTHEANAYCRAHLCVAVKCFKTLISHIKGKNGYLLNNLKKYSTIISDYIFDLIHIAEYLERQKDPNYIFLHGGKNYNVFTFEVFQLSQTLANQSSFNGKPFHIDHKVAQIASIFVLRQALEAKFERLIAVSIQNANGQAPKLRHNYHYDFIRDNSSYFNFKSVDFSHLQKVYDWCNEIVHCVYQPYVWQIAFGHEVCRGLFIPLSTPIGQSWSIYNAIEINHLDDMRTNYINHFCATYDHGIWSFNVRRPEADVV